MGYWLSMFYNDTDIALNENRLQPYMNDILPTNMRSTSKPSLELHVTIDSNDNDIIAENVNVHIDWGGLSQTPL